MDALKRHKRGSSKTCDADVGGRSGRDQRRALILAGGDLDVHGGQRHLWRGSFTWVVGVDGGSRHAVSLDRDVTVLAGDMDSITEERLQALAAVPRVPYPADQDQIDSYIAVEWALAQGAAWIVVAGGLGSRFDQSLANAHLLAMVHRMGAGGVVTDGRQAVYYLAGGQSLVLSEAPGTLLSVLPSGPCIGLTLTGFKWPLDRYALEPGDTRTLSNRFVSDQATLSLARGAALVVVGEPVQ